MTPSLDLDTDLGDVDFLEDVERVFGIVISQADINQWLTLNDVFETVERLSWPSREDASACATSMVFYRIRQAVRDSGHTLLVRPSTELKTIMDDQPRRFFKHVERVSGLRMPPYVLTNSGVAALIILLISIVLLAAAPVFGAPVVTGAALVSLVGSLSWLLKFDPGQLPKDIVTVGDLARRTALTNFSHLKEAGARERPGDLWRALVAVAAEHSGLAEKEITSSHFLFKKMAERAEQTEAI